MIDLLGFVATLCSALMFVPQARTVWGNRHNANAMAGTSFIMLIIMITGYTLWAIYAVVTKAYWAGVPSLMTIPLGLFMVYIHRTTVTLLPTEVEPSPVSEVHWEDHSDGSWLSGTLESGARFIVSKEELQKWIQDTHHAPEVSN